MPINVNVMLVVTTRVFLPQHCEQSILPFHLVASVRVWNNKLKSIRGEEPHNARLTGIIRRSDSGGTSRPGSAKARMPPSASSSRGGGGGGNTTGPGQEGTGGGDQTTMMEERSNSDGGAKGTKGLGTLDFRLAAAFHFVRVKQDAVI